jgi:DNA-binding PadR family transcriptional regulator
MVALTALSLLSERDRHPYDIQREIRSRQKNFVLGLPHSLYRAVERLSRDELIEPIETTKEGSRPERTLYRITEEGRQEFYRRIGQLISAPAQDSPSFAVAIAELDAICQLAETHVSRAAVLEQEYLRAIRTAELAWVNSIIEDLRTARLSWDSPAAIRDSTTLTNPEDAEASSQGKTELQAITSEWPNRD